MDSLYNVKFDPSIDQRVYSPVYLISSIGGALAPMGFPIGGSRSSSSSSGGGGGVPIIGIAICLIAALAMAGLIFNQKSKVKKLEDRKAQLQRDIEAIADIEAIKHAYEKQMAETADILSMSRSTYVLNEQARQLIDDLEKICPKDIILGSFTANSGGISFPITSASYDSIAQFIMGLKELDEIENVYISSLTQAKDEGSDEAIFTSAVTCNYTDPFAAEEVVEEETGELSVGEGE
jgi:type IV pilus assembly protein PilM